MPTRLHPYHAEFTSGELSPRLYGQIDFESYHRGCKEITNWIPLAQGPITRRPGTILVAAAKQSNNNINLKPFIFASTPDESYVLEFGYDDSAQGYIRVHRGDTHAYASVELTASADDVPFDNDSVPDIRAAQVNDVFYFVDGENTIQKLVRSGSSAPGTWTLSEALLVGDPFELSDKRRYKLFTISNDAYRRIAPSDPLSPDQQSRLFDSTESGIDLIKEGFHDDADFAAAWATFGPAYSDVPDYISNEAVNGNIRGFKVWSWEMEGQIFIPRTGTWYFAINGETSIDLAIDGDLITDWYGANATTGDHEYGAKLEFERNGSVSLTGNRNHTVRARMLYYNEINTGNYGFALAWREGGDLEADSGNSGTDDLRLKTENWKGNEIWEIRITIEAGGTTFKVEEREQTDVYNETFEDWTELATGVSISTYTGVANEYSITGSAAPVSPGDFYWNTGSGLTAGDSWTKKFGFLAIPATPFNQRSSVTESSFPKVIDFFENRMIVGGMPELPQTVIGSQVNDYENHELGTNDDEAFEHTLASRKADPIHFLVGARRLIVGTASSIYIVGAEDQALSPSYFPNRVNSFFGSAFIEPVLTSKNILYVDLGKKRIYELEYLIASDSYEPDDLTILSDHLFSDGIKQIVFQRAGLMRNNVPVNLVWALDTNGDVYSLTYERKHNVVAWAQHDFGGTVKSMAVIPGGDGGDELWLAIERDDTVYIEYLSKSVLADGCVTVTEGDPTTTDLEYDYGVSASGELRLKTERFKSKKVVVMNTSFAKLGVATCDTDGVATLEIDDPDADIVVGYSYTSTLNTMPIEVGDSRGTSKGKPKSWAELYVETIDTLGMTVEGETIESNASSVPDSKKLFAPGWNLEKFLTLVADEGRPATVISIHGTLEANG